MELLTRGITRGRKLIITLFALVTVISTVLLFGVKVNYDLTAYLPEDSDSTVALEIMDEEFDAAVPNARVMAVDLSTAEALDLKARIAAIPGVSSVMWLDDVVDLKQPLEVIDEDLLSQYYADGNALFQVAIDEGYEVDATDAIYEIVGEGGGITGNAMSTAHSQKLIVREVVGTIAVMLPIVIVLLIVVTTSWIAPLLFLLTIGVAVLINFGTNIFFKDVSFITQSVSPVLQMAVSLDYSIFLLNSFERFRRQTDTPEEAMRLAVKQSFASIAASAMTTLFGFLALMFMRFGIGSDLGLNLVKGIVLSYISAMVFLPALTLSMYRLIDKTEHKRIFPDCSKMGGRLVKIRVPAMLLVAILIVPAFMAQSRADFLYGNGTPDPATRYGADTDKINEVFGESTQMVLLVPRGETGKELLLCEELKELPNVTDVMSYALSVGSAIPPEFLDEDIVSNFYSENYARIILYMSTGEEGDEAFDAVEGVRAAAAEYYDEYWSCGQSANIYDIKDVITGDSTLVNLIAVVFIFLTLLVTFKSLTLPFILLFVIESAIWINLSVPYFADQPLVYMGYLVMNTVQLGATIDYAILITDGYRERRKYMGKRAAVEGTLSEHFLSVMTSAIILSVAGLSMCVQSTVEIVSALGLLLARGTAMSFALVMLALPGLLMLFDRLTAALTLRGKFLKERK